MGKLLKAAAVAAAMLWAGTAQAALTFEIGPSTGAKLFVSGGGNDGISWTDEIVDYGFADYSVSAAIESYYPSTPDNPDGFAFNASFSYDFVAGPGVKAEGASPPTSWRWDGYMIFSNTNRGTVRITIQDEPGVHVGGYVPLALPEPSTWAMLLIGFGVIGSAMRRRHHVSSAVL